MPGSAQGAPSLADAGVFSRAAEEKAVESLGSVGRVCPRRRRYQATREARRQANPIAGGVGGYRWSTKVAAGPRGLVGRGEGGGSDRTAGSGFRVGGELPRP